MFPYSEYEVTKGDDSLKKFLSGILVGLLISSSLLLMAASSDVVGKYTDFNFVVNGESKTLQDKSIVVSGSSYLPVRAISEMLGFGVNYNGNTRTIDLRSKVKEETNEISLDDNLKNSRELINYLEEKYPSLQFSLSIKGMLSINSMDIITTLSPALEQNGIVYYSASEVVKIVDDNLKSVDNDPPKLISSDYSYLIEIDGKRYFSNQNLQSAVSSDELRYYTNTSAIYVMLSIVYNDEYTIGDSDNQFVDGIINVGLLGDKYVKITKKHSSLNESYTELYVYNNDKTKYHFSSNKPGEENDFLIVSGRGMVSIDDIFGEFGLKYNMQIDHENKSVIVNLDQ